jgi:adenylyltransferase/sulfurtransferase
VPSCAEGGVLGVLPGLIATLQATETVKILTGIGEPLYGRLIQYDALQMEFNEFRLKKDPECPVCGESPTVTALMDYAGFCGVPAVEASDPVDEISAADVNTQRERGDDLLLLDVREPDEYATAHIGGAVLVPLGELEQRLGELAQWQQRRVVVVCKTGARSARACELLRSHGFAEVENLAGGIEAWSLTVDPAIPRY